jgi:hypothetical protein
MPSSSSFEVGGSGRGADGLMSAEAVQSSGGAPLRYRGSTNNNSNVYTGARKEKGIQFSTSEQSFFGSVSHVLTFEPGSVRPLLALLFVPDLTVFYSISQWVHHLIAIGWAIFLMILLGETAFPDGAMGTPACSSDDVTRNRNMCQLVDVLEEAADNFQWLIGFILSGFVAASVATWATRRKNYAALCGTARNLNILVASFVPLDAGNYDLMDVRKTLGRWIMLAMELAMLKARGAMDSADGREHLSSLSLLEPGEWEAMVTGDRHSTVFWWILTEMVKMRTYISYNIILSAQI